MIDIDTHGGDIVTATFDPVPSGWYPAQVIESVLETKENGTRLNLTWEIMDGEHAKRRIWQREWAAHNSTSAQEIGQRMIRTIGQAMGLARVDSSEILCFKPVEIRVGLVKKEDGYEQRNEVKTARKYGAGGAVGAAGPATAGAAASAKPATPWGQKAA